MQKYSVAGIMWPSLIRQSRIICTIVCFPIDSCVWIICKFCLICTNFSHIFVRIIRAPLYTTHVKAFMKTITWAFGEGHCEFNLPPAIWILLPSTTTSQLWDSVPQLSVVEPPVSHGCRDPSQSMLLASIYSSCWEILITHAHRLLVHIPLHHGWQPVEWQNHARIALYVSSTMNSKTFGKIQ